MTQDHTEVRLPARADREGERLADLRRDATFFATYDHASRITDSLEAYRKLIANTTDSYVARLSMRLSYATAIFSAIATVAIPYLVISGIYSMNFARLPFSKGPHGFWIAVGAQAAISLALFAALRWRQLI